MLHQLDEYCKEETLNINYAKTKILRKISWSIHGIPMEQCNSFKYLGVTFSESLNWNTHLYIVRSSTTKIIEAILKFYYTKGGFLVNPEKKNYMQGNSSSCLWHGGLGLEGTYYSKGGIYSKFIHQTISYLLESL